MSNKKTSVELLKRDIEELEALRERLISEYGQPYARGAVISIDRKIKETVGAMARAEMQNLPSTKEAIALKAEFRK